MDWQLEQYERALIMAVNLPHRSSSILLQNCDLPPPLKLFSRSFDDEKDKPGDDDDKKRTFLAPQIATHQIPPPPGIAATPNKNEQWGDELGLQGERENATLLRALQLSQSRAREADKKALLASNGYKRMGSLLFEESLRLSAHRQWVKLLEIEVSLLQQQQQQRQKQQKRKRVVSGEEEKREEEAIPTFALCLTLALCLGIGFALGCCMF